MLCATGTGGRSRQKVDPLCLMHRKIQQCGYTQSTHIGGEAGVGVAPCRGEDAVLLFVVEATDVCPASGHSRGGRATIVLVGRHRVRACRSFVHSFTREREREKRELRYSHNESQDKLSIEGSFSRALKVHTKECNTVQYAFATERLSTSAIHE